MSGFGPLGSYPLAGSGSGPIIATIDLSAAVAAWAGEIVMQFEEDKTEIVQTASNLESILAGIFASEACATKADLTHTANMLLEAIASTSLGAAASIVYTMIEVESVTVNDIATFTARFIERVVDTMIAAGVADSIAQAVDMLVASLSADAIAAIIFSENLTEQVEINAVATHVQKSIHLLVESTLAADVGTDTARFLMVSTEGTVPAGEAVSFGTFLQMATEGVECAALIKINGDEHFAWVVNTETAAASYYENYGFSSLAEYDGRHFGTMPDGIYELAGDTDAGVDISMVVKGGLSNFGSSALKSIPLGYVYLSTTGEVRLKVVETSEGEKAVHWYTLEGRTGGAMHTDRFKPDRGIQSTYFQFIVENIAGADVTIDGMRVFPLIMGRRI